MIPEILKEPGIELWVNSIGRTEIAHAIPLRSFIVAHAQQSEELRFQEQKYTKATNTNHDNTVYNTS